MDIPRQKDRFESELCTRRRRAGNLAHLHRVDDSARVMVRVCEVCQSLSQSTGALVTSRTNGTFRVVVNERVVTLCVEHADEAIAHGTRTLAEIRTHFSEPFPGQRSLVPRRAGDDNPRGAERRRRGRRAGDQA